MKDVIDKLKEAAKSVPDDKPTGISDAIWRLWKFLEQMEIDGEAKAKKADPAVWNLIFKDNH